MESLFERHDEYVNTISMDYVRELMNRIDWSTRLFAIRGAKGVGKSTLMLQYIRSHFAPDDRHVLYISADTSYFARHSLVEVADKFVKEGGQYLFIDEVHKYAGWAIEIKEIYDRHRSLHIVLSGSSLLQINDGESDLSRRLVLYDMPGLSLREYIRIETGKELPSITLNDLLQEPNRFCMQICRELRPLEYFKQFLSRGYYPFYFENKRAYHQLVENTVNYIIDVELTKYRGLEIGNTRNIKALLQIVSEMVPYEVDIAKLARSVQITRPTVLKYLRNLEEAKLIHRLFADIDSIGDLQKPDKILFDNTNLLYTLATRTPDIGTVREAFLVNQLSNAGHLVEYGGLKTGDYRIDKQLVIEVGGADKGFSQIHDKDKALGYVAADDIESATTPHKIPLWAFGFVY